MATVLGALAIVASGTTETAKPTGVKPTPTQPAKATPPPVTIAPAPTVKAAASEPECVPRHTGRLWVRYIASPTYESVESVRVKGSESLAKSLAALDAVLTEESSDSDRVKDLGLRSYTLDRLPVVVLQSTSWDILGRVDAGPGGVVTEAAILDAVRSLRTCR